MIMQDFIQLGDDSADLKQLDVLEEKISKTVELIKQLRAENHELKKYNLELINRVQEKEKKIGQLEDDYQNIKQQNDNSEILKNKEVKIQQKVEEIISKLDSLHDIETNI
jgi:FtsZ-binding cell division protein ZapB